MPTLKKRNPKKKNSTSFTKGHKINKGKRNAAGKVSYDREELANRRLDHGLISRYITLNSHLTRLELRDRLKEKGLSIVEERIIKSLLGDEASLSLGDLINRTAGKVPDVIEHAVRDKYAGWTVEELQAEKRRLSDINRKTLTQIENSYGMNKQQETTPNELATTAIDVTPTKAGEAT